MLSYQTISMTRFLLLHSTGHHADLHIHLRKCNTVWPSESGESVRITWISSEFIMRIVQACWKLLDSASHITDFEQVIQRLVKITDALLYMQGEVSFKITVVTL